MNSTYAICATAFFLMFSYIVSTYGPGPVAWALFFGGLSQFVAQDSHPWARRANIVFAYTAMGFCVWAGMGW